MYVTNLPIAGNLPQNIPIEYKQRAQEFWALDKALESGDLSDGLRAFLLQQNITNPLQTIQKYLQSGYDQQTAEHLLALAYALQLGDQNAAQTLLSGLRKTLRKPRAIASTAASDKLRDDAPTPIPDRSQPSEHGLDTLA